MTRASILSPRLLCATAALLVVGACGDATAPSCANCTGAGVIVYGHATNFGLVYGGEVVFVRLLTVNAGDTPTYCAGGRLLAAATQVADGAGAYRLELHSDSTSDVQACVQVSADPGNYSDVQFTRSEGTHALLRAGGVIDSVKVDVHFIETP